MLENIFGFLLLLIVFLTVLAIFGMLALIKPIRGQIILRLKALKDKIIWSGLIRSIMLTYLKNFVSFYIACKMFPSTSEGQEVEAILLIIFAGVPLISFPIWSVLFLLYNKDKL